MADGTVVIQVKNNAKQAARDFDRLDKSLDNTEKELKQVDKQANLSSKAFSALRSNIGKIGVAAGLLAVGVKLKDMAVAAIQTGIAFEALDNKFKAAAGSLAGAERSLGFVTDTTDELGIAFRQTADAYAGFVASATRSGLTFKQTEDIFKDVATAATSLQLPAERVDLVFRALEQIASKGVVSMEELKLQLGDSLPGAVQIAAKAMGVTNAEFLKMVSNGEVLSEKFLPKFARQLREDLGGSAEDAAKSLQSSINRSNNAYAEFERAFSERTSFIVKGWNNLKEGAFEFATALIDIDRRPKLEKAKDNVLELERALSKAKDELQETNDELKQFGGGVFSEGLNKQADASRKKIAELNRELSFGRKEVRDLNSAINELNSEGGEDDPITKEVNLLKDLQDEANKAKVSLQNIFLSGGEGSSEFESTLAQYQQLTDKINQAKDATKGFQKSAIESFDFAGSAADNFSRNATRSLFDPWEEGETAAERFKEVALNTIKDILAEFLAAELKKQAAALFTAALSGGTSLLSGFGGGATTASAKGNVFSGGNVTDKFANGGVFTNSVVSRPTTFPMANGGTGLMGEAGAEAIMPLDRDRTGRLGVQVQQAPVNVNVINNAPVQIQTVSRPNNQFDIVVNQVSSALANSGSSVGVTEALSRQSQSGVFGV